MPEILDRAEIYKQLREHWVKVIKERPAAELEKNTERHLKAITEFYLQKLASQKSETITQPQPAELHKNTFVFSKEKVRLFLSRHKHNKDTAQPPPQLPPTEKTKEEVLSEFGEKVESFRQYFEKEVFAHIVHYSNKEIAGGVIKSPGLLAREKGEDISKHTAHSGGLDQEIGNTEYVFANAWPLLSRSASGSSAYHIQASEGFVVPWDIADLEPAEYITDFKERDVKILELYSKNLYTIDQFKVFFATYCAAFFATPAQALEFFYQEKVWLLQADRWGDLQVEITNFKENIPIKRMMRDLFVSDQVIPPLSPEFQFKDSVIATQEPKYKEYFDYEQLPEAA